MAIPMPQELHEFIVSTLWTFAKTYAETYPHEYIVRDRVDPALYDQMSELIDNNGYTENYYNKPVIYLDHDGYTYWHMGIIINRCVVADTFHRRKQDGRLPDQWSCNK